MSLSKSMYVVNHGLANYGNQNLKLLVLLSYLGGLKVRSHLID